jgi:hypothetical protein
MLVEGALVAGALVVASTALWRSREWLLALGVIGAAIAALMLVAAIPMYGMYHDYYRAVVDAKTLVAARYDKECNDARRPVTPRLTAVLDEVCAEHRAVQSSITAVAAAQGMVGDAVVFCAYWAARGGTAVYYDTGVRLLAFFALVVVGAYYTQKLQKRVRRAAAFDPRHYVAKDIGVV